VRAGGLMNYQSHKGELALEREDGTLVFGKQAVGDLAAQWRDEADGREPSNDVLSFTLTLPEPNPAQSEEMQQLRHAQQRVLTQEQRDRQELAIQNREAFREQQSRKTENESEGQSE